MRVITEERLKKKYLERTLELIKTNRSMAAPEANLRPEEWGLFCAGQVQVLIETVLDLVETGIAEMEEEEQLAAKKPGNFKGTVVDGSVVNGDYV